MAFCFLLHSSHSENKLTFVHACVWVDQQQMLWPGSRRNGACLEIAAVTGILSFVVLSEKQESFLRSRPDDRSIATSEHLWATPAVAM